MLNWRDIGLRRGGQGNEFSAVTLTCPYCSARGKFNRVFRSKAREGDGELYNDVWQCLQCAHFSFVIWRVSQGFFNYRAFPYEKAFSLCHPSWPQTAAHSYEEAVGALLMDDWENAIVMIKHAIGAATAAAYEHTSGPLLEEFRNLAKQGTITRSLLEWAETLPALAATPQNPDAQQAREMVRMCRYLLEQLYTLPYDAAGRASVPKG